MFKFYSKICR